MVNTTKKFIAAAVLGALMCSASARANGVLLTYAEDPGQLTSTLYDTSVMTFDAQFVGAHTAQSPLSWAGVGSYDHASVIAADRYGGAGGTGYYLVESNSVGARVITTTLTLNTPSAYFGLWWSAGDSKNRLEFFNGSNLVADFTTASLVNVLPNTYKGNPNAAFLGQNSGEKYAFFNIYADNGTTFDKILFTNVGSSGFESDNHSVRINAWGTQAGETGAAPGVAVIHVDGTTITAPVAAVPETSTWVMGFLALGAVGFMVRRNARLSA